MATGVKVTPAEFVEKHTRNTINAIPDYEKGIEKVATAPGVLAAAKKDKMRQNLLKSIDDGKWEERVKAVPLDTWKQKTKAKGAARIADGIQQSEGVRLQFAEQFLDHVGKVKATVDAMSDLTLEDSKRRMIANMEGLSKFRFKRGS